MANWRVELKAGTSLENSPLKWLSSSPQTLLCQILYEDERYYLCSSLFDGLSVALDVVQRAEGLIAVLNGCLKLGTGDLYDPIVFSGRVEYEDEARKEFYLMDDDTPLWGLWGIDLALIDPTDPATSSQDILAKWLDTASTDTAANEAFRHFSNDLNWFNLFKVYEVVKSEAKSTIICKMKAA